MSLRVFQVFNHKLSRLSLVVVMLCAAAYTYFAFSPTQLAKHYLFYPVKTIAYYTVQERMCGGKGHHVQFRSKSGALLHGLHVKKPNSKITFLLHYGQGGNIGMNIGLAKMVLLSGQSVFAYDYEGYGMSTGKPSCEALLDDGLAAYDYLVGKGNVKPSQVIQYGVSLGTGVACHVANKRQSAGVVLFSPYTSLHKVAKERLPFLNFYPRIMFPSPDLGAKDFISTNETVPVFIWHGGNDWVIDVSHTKNLAKIANCKLQVFIEKEKHHGDWSINELAEKMKVYVEKLPLNNSEIQCKSI